MEVIFGAIGVILGAILLLSVFGPTVVLSIGVIVNYLRALWTVLISRKGDPILPTGPEPAYKLYAFHGAWVEYSNIVKRSFESSRELVAVVREFCDELARGRPRSHSPFPLAALVGGLLGVVTYVVFGLVHLLIVAAFCAVFVALAYLFRLIEYVAMLFRRIFMVCPHADCHRRIALPHYQCPNCGAKHERLIPGPYGTFRRRCRCGHRLPTLFLFGRNKLPSLCPHPSCGRPLNEAIGTIRNLHFPIIGGPAAGKSTLLAAAMVVIDHLKRSGNVGLELPGARDERTFQAFASTFGRGLLPAKTAEYSPTALMFKLTDGRGARVLVYVYDAAGELYAGSDRLQGQQFFSYCQGMMLVVDPYSLPHLREDAGIAVRLAEAGMSWSTEAPSAVLERMLGAIRGFTGETGQLGKSLAVVLTKVDGPGLEAIAARSRSGDDEQTSAAIRAWLEQQGEGNFVRSIDRAFADVRYFACTALGRTPDGSAAPFTPLGATAPLAWLLGRNGIALVPLQEQAVVGASDGRVSRFGTLQRGG